MFLKGMKESCRGCRDEGRDGRYELISFMFCPSGQPVLELKQIQTALQAAPTAKQSPGSILRFSLSALGTIEAVRKHPGEFGM